MKSIRSGLIAVAGVLPAMLCNVATADQAEQAAEPDADNTLSEIVVTAQRRSESVQKVPIAIAAFDGSSLRQAGIEDSLDIAREVPNVSVSPWLGNSNVSIRGIGSLDFNAYSTSPVSMYIDDVLIGSNAGQTFALFDLDRVEVLRGPQGTLFGKNSTGGNVDFYSKLPDNTEEGYARVTFGEYNLYEAESAVTIPVTDTFSFRVAALTRHSDGDRYNLYSGEHVDAIDQNAARAILRWRPDDSTDVRLTVSKGVDRSDGPTDNALTTMNGANILGYHATLGPGSADTNEDGPNRLWSDVLWTALDVSRSFGPWSLKSITSYTDTTSQKGIDIDGTPVDLISYREFAASKQLTQEARLSYSSSSLEALAGFYYYYEQFSSLSATDTLGALAASGGNTLFVAQGWRLNNAYAPFVQGTYAITSALHATLGARYTVDNVKDRQRTDEDPQYFLPVPGGVINPNGPGPSTPIIPFAVLQDTYKSPTWRAALDYQIDNDVMTYASVNRGFRAGGFNIGAIFSPVARTEVFPEVVTAYEVGLKSSWLDRTLRVNVSLFDYDYTNLQVSTVENYPGSAVPAQVTKNAAKARIRGAEFEVVSKPVSWFETGVNTGYLDAKYSSYPNAATDAAGNFLNYTGNVLPNAPTFTITSHVQFTMPAGRYQLMFRADDEVRSRVYFTSAEDPLLSNGGSTDVLNLRAAVSDPAHHWELAAWGKNVTNQTLILNATDITSLGTIPRYLGPRESYGLDFHISF